MHSVAVLSPPQKTAKNWLDMEDELLEEPLSELGWDMLVGEPELRHGMNWFIALEQVLFLKEAEILKAFQDLLPSHRPTQLLISNLKMALLYLNHIHILSALSDI